MVITPRTVIVLDSLFMHIPRSRFASGAVESETWFVGQETSDEIGPLEG